jgi:hypothetical protein
LYTHTVALDFCIEWFDSNTKENFKIHLEIALENFEKKKKMVSPLPSSSARPYFLLQPSSTPPFFCAGGPSRHGPAAQALGLLPALSLLG